MKVVKKEFETIELETAGKPISRYLLDVRYGPSGFF